MGKDLFSRYIWIVDTLRRHKRLTRAALDELWKRSGFSDGNPMPRRTFYNYRNAIAELFDIEILHDPATYEYYIEETKGPSDKSLTDHLLDSAAMNSLLADARPVSDSIIVEEVPSARQYLSTAISALRLRRVLRFTYHSYTRARPVQGVELKPYFLNLFKQRWYATGLECASDKIKTYALDRMSAVELTDEVYEMPPNFDARSFVEHSFGSIHTGGNTYDVRIQATPQRAKYLRGLPLHHSQRELMTSDSGSVFGYRLRLTHDLVQEILRYGPELTVLSPEPLRAMIRDELFRSLENYGYDAVSRDTAATDQTTHPQHEN